MPKYEHKTPKAENVVSELVITEREAAEMLGVNREDVYFRVIHELPIEAAPWAVVRLQAVRR
jgi:hypothetical protein